MTDHSASQALKAGDQLLGELSNAPARPSPAPTMGRLAKIRYSHADMIDYIIQNPWTSQNEIAARYGYTPSWISNVLASDAFQNAMAERKEEIVDPALKATIEERMKALYIKSLEVLMKKLEGPTISDNLAIRAAELGARGVGVGGMGHPSPPAVAPQPDRLVILAERLVMLNRQTKGEVYEGQGIPVSPEPASETVG